MPGQEPPGLLERDGAAVLERGPPAEELDYEHNNDDEWQAGSRGQAHEGPGALIFAHYGAKALRQLLVR